MIFFNGKAQVQSGVGYYVSSDSAKTIGRALSFDPDNPGQFIEEFNNGTSRVLPADSILEFGLGLKKRFFSRTIEIDGLKQRVFLEIITEGRYSLLFLESSRESKFYLEREGTDLIVLKKGDYESVLERIPSECPDGMRSLGNLRYTVKSVNYAVNQINDEVCGRVPRPHVGVVAGVNFSGLKFSNSSFINDLPLLDNSITRTLTNTGPSETVARSTGLTFGVFLNTPFWKVKNLSLQARILYSANNYSSDTNSQLTSVTVIPVLFGRLTVTEEFNVNRVVNVESNNLMIDLAPEYTFDLGMVRPFVSLGPGLMITNGFQSRLQTSYTGRVDFLRNMINLDRTDIFESSRLNFGYSFSAGAEYFYTQRRYVALELSYSRFDGDNFDVSNFFITVNANL